MLAFGEKPTWWLDLIRFASVLTALAVGAAAIAGAWDGYWPGVNGPATLLALASSLAALGLAWQAPRRLPLSVWVVLGFGILSYGLAPGHRFPLQDFIGSPEVRESGTSWLGIAWLAAVIAALARRSRRTRVRLLLVVLGISLLYAALAWPDPPQVGYARWYHYDDQLGIWALHLALFSSGLAVGRQWRGLALVVAACLLATSENRSAFAALLLVAPAVYGLLVLLRTRCGVPWRRALAVVFVVLVPLALAGIEVLAMGYPSASALPMSADLAERGVYVGVVGADIAERPLAVVMGHGWASFPEVTAKFGPLAQGWKGLAPTDPGRWSGVDGMGIHSHHGAIEALLAGGVPLLAMALAVGTVHAWPGRRRRWEWPAALAVAVSLVHATWFLLPLNQVSYAFALATAPLGGWMQQLQRRAVRVSALGSAGVIVLAAVLAHRQVQAPLPAEYAQHRCLSPSWPDRQSGGYVLAQQLSQALRGARRAAEALPAAERQDRLKALAAALCGAVQLGPQQASLRTQAVMVLALSELALELPPATFAALAAQHRPDWERWTLALLEAAPERGDLALALAATAMAEGDADLIQALANAILRQHPGDAVGAWLVGLAELTRGEVEAGLARLKALVASGIGKRIAIPPELAALLEQTTVAR